MVCKKTKKCQDTSPETDRALFKSSQHLILASGSPRRRDFFTALGFDFEIITAPGDETPFEGEDPESFAARMAQEKAAAIALKYPESWVVGADTVVTLEGLILGKPQDANDAYKMLKQLSGRKHTVITAYALLCEQRGVRQVRAVATEVEFHSFSDAVLHAYANSGEPLDKAGSYGVQGKGSFLVRKITGSCTNVIGLPISDLVTDLLRYQVIEPV